MHSLPGGAPEKQFRNGLLFCFVWYLSGSYLVLSAYILVLRCFHTRHPRRKIGHFFCDDCRFPGISLVWTDRRQKNQGFFCDNQSFCASKSLYGLSGTLSVVSSVRSPCSWKTRHDAHRTPQPEPPHSPQKTQPQNHLLHSQCCNPICDSEDLFLGIDRENKLLFTMNIIPYLCVNDIKRHYEA